MHCFFFFGGSHLTTAGDEGGGMGGRRGEVAHGGRARGEMGEGTREQCGSNKSCTVFFFFFGGSF